MIFNIPHPRGFIPAGFEWRHGQPDGIHGIMVSEATAKQKIETGTGQVRRLWVYDGVTNLNKQVYNIPKGYTALISAAPGIPASNAKLEPGTPSSRWQQ